MEPIENEIETRFFRKAPPVAATGDFINAILDGIVIGIKIKIAESCTTSISDYVITKQDKDGGVLKKRETNPVTKVSFEPNGHLVDTMRYFIVKAFYEQYQRFCRRFSDYSDTSIPVSDTSLLEGF